MATHTEIKAEEKAEELIENLSSQYDLSVDDAKIRAGYLCDQLLDVLSSIKGMGKIHKVKLWKLIKENIENYAE
jgi:uncharacterized protein YeeX (DUF496 family)